MEIGAIGYNHRHGRDFVMEKSSAESSWLFLLLKSSAIFEIGGEKITTEANSFILYQYGTPQKYAANGEDFINDFIYISMNEQDKQLLRALEIPLDTVIKLGDVSQFHSMICTMAFENSEGNFYRTDIGALYLHLLFFKISSQMKNLGQKGSAIANLDRMNYVRKYIYEFPNIHHSIDELARRYTMSRSGFQHSYKKAFGKSFTEDLTNARIERAKKYLLTGKMTVAQTAENCGYNSDLHFIRQFTKVCGMTPTQYRKANKENNISK